RTLFQVPYPVSPLLATLTKTAGVYTNNSRSGSNRLQQRRGALHSSLALTTVFKFFLFTPLRTLLHSPKTQLFYFQPIPHSLPKNCLVTRHALHSVPRHPLHRDWVWVQRSNARRSSSIGSEVRFRGTGWRSSRPARGGRQLPIGPIRRTALC